VLGKIDQAEPSEQYYFSQVDIKAGLIVVEMFFFFFKLFKLDS
jgi:hypothetical protein